MSAANASITSNSLDAERRSHEPSMEEILASIRRIIADDEVLPIRRGEKEDLQSPRRSEPAEPSRFVPRAIPIRGELHDPLTEIRPAALAEEESREDEEAEHAPEGLDDSDEGEIEESRDDNELQTRDDDFSETEDDEADDADAFAPEDAAGTAHGHPPLVSANAAASVASHFQALAAGMMISEAHVVERYAQDLLRPMLKQWLDDNLPALVERLVRAEIERVARGRR